VSAPTPPAWLPAGPIETDPTGQVVRAIAPNVFDWQPLAGVTEILRALEGAPVGAYDRRIAEVIDRGDTAQVTVVLSWLYRARAAGAAAERARLAGLLRQTMDRQDAEWEAQPEEQRPGYLYRSWYLGALLEAAQLVEGGGANGLPVRVDQPGRPA
jgi:hypothetical protein